MSTKRTYRESDWRRDDHGRYAGRVASPPAATLSERAARIARTGATPATTITREHRGHMRHFWADALRTAPIDLDRPAPKIDMVIGGVKTIQHPYKGGAGTLRMPSVAALERMADTGVTTFDIPVQASLDGGHVAGWCRVSRNDRGAWAVEPLGMDDKAGAAARRQVSWVLGNEHPNFALNEFGSMAELAAETERRAGTEPAAIHSRALQEIGYCDRESTLYATTHDGSTYGWRAPRDVYERMLDGSAGSIFSREVAHKLDRVDAQQCPDCGRFYSVTGASIDHTCPAQMGRAEPGAGDDTLWAGRVVTGHRRTEGWEAAREAVADRMVDPSSLLIPGLTLGEGQNHTRRFRGVSGQDATTLTAALGEKAWAGTPAPGEALAAAADDQAVGVNGRFDDLGMTVEEITYQCDAPDGDAAWAKLRQAHRLPTTPDPDRSRRGPDGTWRFWFASAVC
ncbi:KTSC domain-containing protein [Actinomyces sp. 594]|uniref:KTSC domain-containing protein n=1 Tax=Actinomyces sp. 594 TaxID=2057793 RepID=UPI001C590994|nr:KTSC domain-containing protein [Actinomyces sp. 594]MBW3068574.1 KTSC domain-containing protein [Actinomyces sp. 594]